MRYEEKIRIKDNSSPVKKCWEEKAKAKKKELYSREKSELL